MMLAVSLGATLCANVFINGVAFLIPMLHAQHDTSLARGGLLASLPSFGMVLTLFAWGYLLDRVGERIVLALGLILTAAAGFAAAIATTVVMLVLALSDHLNWSVAVPVMVIAAAIRGDSGLPFTTIPELAGPFWSGRALSTQNALERLMVAVGPPVFGGLISTAGYPLAFVLCGLFPLAALPFVPVGAQPQRGNHNPPS
jgi:MFS family permease